MPFTDAVVAALTAQAAGTATGDPSAIAALEAACALYTRAFAAATIDPPEARAVLSPPRMALLARNLIRRGEDVHQIIVDRGRVRLQPIGSWDVRGGPAESQWWYRCDRFGPSGNLTELVPAAAVLHCRYAVDSARPWYGIGPLGWARSTGTLAANLETRLGEEAGAPVGHVIPVPSDGGDGSDDDPLASLKSDMAAARGRTLLAETTAAGWGEGRTAAPQADYRPQRFGAAPPATLPSLRTEAGMSVLSACGVPVSLVTDADGTSQREAWRRFVMGSIEPLLSMLAVEVEAKLETRVTFDLSSLWAHDLAGRAASFKAMVTAGMEVERAARLSGLLGAE
ncbi:MAG: phage portal protein [Thiotrichales bacterium]|nr:phage portal protein [Thiotrichales bacterium]